MASQIDSTTSNYKKAKMKAKLASHELGELSYLDEIPMQIKRSRLPTMFDRNRPPKVTCPFSPIKREK